MVKKREERDTYVDLKVFEKFHAIAVYDAVVILVKSDNGVLGEFHMTGSQTSIAEHQLLL